MKKYFVLILILFSVVKTTAQSEEMKTMIKLYRNEVVKSGFSIIVEGYSDINAYRSITSGTLDFKASKQYGIIVFAEKCCSIKMTLNVNGESAELQYRHDCQYNVTNVMSSFTEISGRGEIIASMDDVHWHKGYMLIGVK